MEVRGSAHPARVAAAAGLLIAVLAARTTAAAPGAGKGPGTRRTVRVMVLADPALRHDGAWKVDIFRAVSDASRALADISGPSLKIKAFGYWAPFPPGATKAGDRGRATALRALASMNRHLAEAGRGGCELVIGLIPESPECSRAPGAADYLMGTVVVTYLGSRGGIPYVLLHEVLHIFGAIDLETTGQLMSRKDPSFRIDRFTRAVVRINKERSFSPPDFPLSEGLISQAIDLYAGRRALYPGETELDICVRVLSAAQARPVAAQAPSVR